MILNGLHLKCIFIPIQNYLLCTRISKLHYVKVKIKLSILYNKNSLIKI